MSASGYAAVTVERLGHLGDGLTAEGLPVAMALPGEEVEGEIVEGRMSDPKVLRPSPDRVRAPCPHYRACGGCGLMHASDSFVAGWKVDVVRRALAAQGLSAGFRPIVTSPPRSRRRAVLSGRRTKTGALVGFHARASDTLVEIPHCLLLRPELVEALPSLRAAVVLGGSRKGEITLTLTLTDGGLDVDARGGKPADGPMRAELAALAGRAGWARLAWDGDEIAVYRPPAVRFGTASVALPPGAFLQATAEGEAALVAAVTDAVGAARRVADLFAGAGTFALPLAAVAEVHAAEGDDAMVAALGQAARGAAGLHRVTAETRDLFRRPLLRDELARFDAVVIDPPRAGCEAQTREIAASGVPVIAAVSCNPVTFARDARILSEGGYRLDWVQVVDQFRWSPHVELVARLTKP